MTIRGPNHAGEKRPAQTDVSRLARVIVVGASGFIGTWVCRAASQFFTVVGTFATNSKVRVAGCEYLHADITVRAAMQRLVTRIAPAVIIHVGGTRSVEWCEKFRAEAERVHLQGTRNVVAAAEEVDAKVVFISTDSVFDGREPEYCESATPRPVSHYGAVKLLAEEAVLGSKSDSVVLRSSLVFGWSFGNQATNTVVNVVRSLRAGRVVELPSGLVSTPLYVGHTATNIVAVARSDLKGVFHLAGGLRVSRYELGVAAAQTFGLESALVRSITEESCLRPANACLDSGRLRRALGLPTSDYRDGLIRMRSDPESPAWLVS